MSGVYIWPRFLVFAATPRFMRVGLVENIGTYHLSSASCNEVIHIEGEQELLSYWRDRVGSGRGTIGGTGLGAGGEQLEGQGWGRAGNNKIEETKLFSKRFPLCFLWFAYTSYRGTTLYSKSKTKPLCFLSENLEIFAQNNFFFFLANLDSASKVESWFHQPPPPPPPHWTLEFWVLANLNSASNSTSPPPTLNMGILDFSKIELSIKFHEPPPPPLTWEFWILANLNSALNSMSPPPPHPNW